MKHLFEASVIGDRFSINQVYQNLFSMHIAKNEPYITYKSTLESSVGVKDSKTIISSLLRFSFYIEPVQKPKIETTKYDVRWSNELLNDPRYTSFEDCLVIFQEMFGKLIHELQNQENKQLIKFMINNTNVSYEIPIDYISANVPHIHSLNNISWIFGTLPKSLVNLRIFLMKSSEHNYTGMFKEVYKKIRTKTYLTDRVLTGMYKTNREKRWECHPNSVHFALRKVAWGIELKLITQICHFEGFPEDLKGLLTKKGLISFDNNIVRCPITLEPLSFALFKAEVENTVHGKSSFQVGHMNPLKADDSGEDVVGHTPENISWISEQGNRIQGSNSVDFIREIIVKIYNNYKKAGYTKE